MSVVLSRAPSRSYEPLAIRICKAAHTIMYGKRSQWASVATLSQVIRVKDEEMLSSAISLAAQKGWLMVGGQPVHSVLLTDKGEAVALKKSGHSNAPTPKTVRVTTAKK
jgi:hypothetical protein